MKEIEQLSRMSEKYPAMTTPLVNHLHFDGMVEYGNTILLGQAVGISDLELYTKICLDKLAEKNRSLPD